MKYKVGDAVKIIPYKAYDAFAGKIGIIISDDGSNILPYLVEIINATSNDKICRFYREEFSRKFTKKEKDLILVHKI